MVEYWSVEYSRNTVFLLFISRCWGQLFLVLNHPTHFLPTLLTSSKWKEDNISVSKKSISRVDLMYQYYESFDCIFRSLVIHVYLYKCRIVHFLPSGCLALSILLCKKIARQAGKKFRRQIQNGKSPISTHHPPKNKKINVDGRGSNQNLRFVVTLAPIQRHGSFHSHPKTCRWWHKYPLLQNYSYLTVNPLSLTNCKDIIIE